MKIKITTLVVLLAIFCNWQCTTDPYAYDVSTIIEMSKTPCFGTCPEYEIKINGKGLASYEGKKFVKLEGSYTKTLSDQATNDLMKAFVDADFWSFEDEYTSDISDLPTTYIAFSHGGQSKKIKDYYNAPEALKALEKLVEDIVEEEGWEKQE